MIEATRIRKGAEPGMRRIVVAIDPAVSVSETSDATGIIVAGIGDDGHGYVLEDLSGKYSPTEWATKAIAAYKRHEADRIIVEKNQGGDLVANTLAHGGPCRADPHGSRKSRQDRSRRAGECFV